MRVYGWPVSETIESLSEAYWKAVLKATPSEAHLQGHYPTQSGRFEDASRTEEDRQIGEFRDFVSRADALDADNLDDVQKVTRAVLAGTARDTADLLEARLKEIAHGRRCPPIRFCTGSPGHAWGPQASVVHKTASASEPIPLRAAGAPVRANFQSHGAGPVRGARPPSRRPKVGSDCMSMHER